METANAYSVGLTRKAGARDRVDEAYHAHVAAMRSREVVAAGDVRDDGAVHKILGDVCRIGIIVARSVEKVNSLRATLRLVASRTFL